MGWKKAIIHWQTNGDVFISVAFTWHLPQVRTLATWYRQAGRCVHMGGPAVALMPDYVKDAADQVGGPCNQSPLKRHNPDATFTSRGCVHQCGFCAVPRIEGPLEELATWEPAPTVCDNNVLATSQKHFDRVIDRLKPISHVDFNQGLNVRMLTGHHIDRLKELHLPMIRIAFDHIGMESKVMNAIDQLRAAGFPRARIRCFVLFGFNDHVDDAMERMLLLRARGIRPSPQRYQAIEGKQALKKDAWVGPGWDPKELKKFQRYWSRQNWFSRVPYEDFQMTSRAYVKARCP
jgi:hypothetical protein